MGEEGGCKKIRINCRRRLLMVPSFVQQQFYFFSSNDAFTYSNGVILFYGFAWQKSQEQMDACPWPEFIAWLPFFSCINDNGTFFLARSRASLFGAYKNIAIFFAFFPFQKKMFITLVWILLCQVEYTVNIQNEKRFAFALKKFESFYF